MNRSAMSRTALAVIAAVALGGCVTTGTQKSTTHVTTIEPLLRLAVQQSNCFVITSIGNLRTDSRLSRITDIQRNSGEYRAGSKQQEGQRVAAD